MNAPGSVIAVEAKDRLELNWAQFKLLGVKEHLVPKKDSTLDAAEEIMKAWSRQKS